MFWYHDFVGCGVATVEASDLNCFGMGFCVYHLSIDRNVANLYRQAPTSTGSASPDENKPSKMATTTETTKSS
jgi:hypothetical protein